MKRRLPMPGQLGLDFDAEAPSPPPPPPLPVDAPALLREMHAWTEAGVLRRLDSALAAFFATLAPGAPAEVLLATALVSYLEGQGHACLELDELIASGGASVGWPETAASALGETMQRLPPTSAAWADALRACDAVGDGHEDDGADETPPLVLDGRRLYLRRYWRYETTVVRQVLARAGAVEPVDPVATRIWLDRLFPRPAASPTGTVDWQKAACAIALRGRLSIVTGGPGTGKTYTAARLLALTFALAPEPARLRVALAAPTGKAAARLKASIVGALAALQPVLAQHGAPHDLASRVGPARTLHRLLGARPDTRAFRHGAANRLELDLLIVDEASMVDLETMAALLDALPPEARVVLLGDKDQLASVEAGAVLGDLCEGVDADGGDAGTRAYLEAVLGVPMPGESASATPIARQTVVLRESRRFSGPIGALARAVDAGDAGGATALLRDPGQTAVNWAGAPSAVNRAGAGRAGGVRAEVLRLALGTTLSGGYRRYAELLPDRPTAPDPDAHAAWVRRVLEAFDTFRVLCALREGEGGALPLNAAIEGALAGAKLLRTGTEWYDGRPVMVTRNDPAAGVFNGDVGIALRPCAPAAALRVFFADGAALRSVATTRLAQVETAFATTVHKAQGSEFDHTVLVLGAGQRGASRELVYTGVTRARTTFSLVADAPDALAGPLGRRTRRGSGLGSRLRGREPG